MFCRETCEGFFRMHKGLSVPYEPTSSFEKILNWQEWPKTRSPFQCLVGSTWRRIHPPSQVVTRLTFVRGFSSLNISIWLINRTLTDTNTPSKSGPESNGNDKVLHISHSSRLEPHHQMQFNIKHRTDIYIYIYIYESVRNMMVTIVGNEHGDPSLNSGWSCSHFT